MDLAKQCHFTMGGGYINHPQVVERRVLVRIIGRNLLLPSVVRTMLGDTSSPIEVTGSPYS